MVIHEGDYISSNNPELYKRLDDAHKAVLPVVEELGSSYHSTDGAVTFVQDPYYSLSAGALAAVNVPGLASERLDFQRENVTGHRIYLPDSRLGDTFATQTVELAPSKMNPEHKVCAIPLEVGADPEHDSLLAAFQFAFNIRAGKKLPSEKQLLSLWAKYQADIEEATRSLVSYSTGVRSISDEALLDPPTTPNAFIVNWDIDGSTKMADENYPYLRNYLTDFSDEWSKILKARDGNILRQDGDGQWVYFDIPTSINRNDLRAVGEYGRDFIVPTLEEIAFLNETSVARRHPMISPTIRIAVELGYVEETTMGPSGPVLWQLARQSKEHSGRTGEKLESRLILGRKATEAITLANAA